MTLPSSRRARVTGAALGAVLLGACDRVFTSVHPVGPQAERISDLTWFLVALGSTVYVVVIGFFLYALWRGSRRTENASGPEAERRITRWVAGSVLATTLILLAVLIVNFSTGRALASFAEPDALTITVVGHQWWWEVVYQDPAAHRRLTTANEIRVPVGRRVRLLTQSRDVIHSFWAPNVHGKLDMIPGYSGTTFFQVDEPGIYRGQCAEFCGLQHAKMAFQLIAMQPDSFAAWYDRQLDPAPPPPTELAQEGQEVFLSKQCAMCHTIRGTPAGSRFGPDLTHLASRNTIGAGTLPNTRGHLGGWVVDPQKIKPGVNMPPNALSSEELHALLSYLESLK